ncbi:hypothetical protein B9479_006285 [Cryptococcus floricola]|uniref:Uncharacterized protein n=1 Tax=Cryptococcus floricola TaxID=2591691 RepID=A0A5D3AQQ4_9TREE|nr:hypothetical protein B9479_006285 [Cryptococcus floricola]
MSSCKLCHGPLAPSASIKKPLECHATCIQFACPGCVKANKPSFSIINLNNHIYDYQCAECTAQTPTVSHVTHTKVGSANATTTIC